VSELELPGSSTSAPLEDLGRLTLLDLMRTVALLRVVALHVTGIDPLTWFASMPVMFFVAGSLFSRSTRSRRGLTVVRDRFRRILPSLAGYALLLTVLYGALGLLTPTLASVRDAAGWITELGIYDTARLYVPVISLEPPVGPGSPTDALYWTWNPLWYLHTHLLLVLIGPLLVAGYRRRRGLTLGIVGALWVLDAVANRGTFNTPTFLVFFVLGFTFDDGTLLALSRRTVGRWGLAAAVVGLALIPFGPELGINQWVPSLFLLGVAWIAAALYWRAPLERVAATRLVRPVIAFVNRRALTIYLWSLLGVYLSRLLFPVDGDGVAQLAGTAIVSLALTAAVTLVACVAVGWIEDVAARRRPQLWPAARA
jgi:hypothetical protein